jgi:transcriptional regulator with XRE-family HTH domain
MRIRRHGVEDMGRELKTVPDNEVQGDPDGKLHERLQYLRSTRRGLGNKPLGYDEIAAHVSRATGRRTSTSAIEKLFTGKAGRRPEPARLAAVLAVFGETPERVENRGDPNGTFGQRLQHLRYQHAQEHGTKLPSQEQLAAHVRAYTHGSCTGAYISALIKDEERAAGISASKVAALADFFDVSPAFFFDDAPSQAINRAEQGLAQQQDFLDVVNTYVDLTGGVPAAFRGLQKLDPADLPKITAAIRTEIDQQREADTTAATPLFQPPRS